PSYLSLYAQIIAVGGVFVFGFITSWIFGREFADNTIKDLLALPYSRAVIILAKFVASFMTNIILSVYIVTLGFFIGFIIYIADNTIKSRLARPYSRVVIILAKFVASFMTNIILSVYIVTLGFFIGWLIDIPEWSLPFVAEGLYIVLIVTMMTIILSTPIAFLA